MTVPICTITQSPSVNSVIAHFCSADSFTRVNAAYLLDRIDELVVYTTNGEVNDGQFSTGFAFAVSLESYALIGGDSTPEKGILKVIELFNALGVMIQSYNYNQFDNTLVASNLKTISLLYSSRFFAFSSAISYTSVPSTAQCSCPSSLPLLNGPWHNEQCDMFNQRDFVTRYDDKPPCTTLILNGEYGLDSITITLREGLLVITKINATDEPVYGNVVTDLVSLARSRFVDYVISLNFQLDTDVLPPRWIQ